MTNHTAVHEALLSRTTHWLVTVCVKRMVALTSTDIQKLLGDETNDLNPLAITTLTTDCCAKSPALQLNEIMFM